MPYDFSQIQSGNAYAEAESKGCKVVTPQPNQLFVDIDDANGSTCFYMNIGKIAEHIGVLDTQWSASPSGEDNHSHVIVSLVRAVNEMERILLQAIIGSDLKREALSWIRLVNNDPTPTLFYEKKPLQLTEGSANADTVVTTQ